MYAERTCYLRIPIVSVAVGGSDLSFYLLSGFSDWLLSPVVVVSIKGDFFTSFLLLVSCKQRKEKSER